MSVNLLLAVLPEDEQRHIAPYCEKVIVDAFATLCSPDEPVQYAYFPQSCVCSSLVHARNGEAVEVAMVGREGMVGLPLVLGEATNPFEVMVQIPGVAMRVPRDVFVSHTLESNRTFRDALLKYANLYLATVAQTAVCNRVHRIEQRLARWLLAMHDRTGWDELPITHEVLGLMLGAYRPSITNALRVFSKRRLLRLARGRVTITDSQGLEGQACECHETVRRRTAATLRDIRRLAA